MRDPQETAAHLGMLGEEGVRPFSFTVCPQIPTDSDTVSSAATTDTRRSTRTRLQSESDFRDERRHAQHPCVRHVWPAPVLWAEFQLLQGRDGLGGELCCVSYCAGASRTGTKRRHPSGPRTEDRDTVQPPLISRAMQSYTGKALACPGWVLENSAALGVNGMEEGAERGNSAINRAKRAFHYSALQSP